VGLYVYQITSDGDIEPYAYYDGPGQEGWVAAQDSIVVISDGGGLRVANLLNPSSSGYFNDSGETRDVAILGDRAYLTSTWWWPDNIHYFSYIHEIDISDPTSPVLLHEIGGIGPDQRLAVSGNRLIGTSPSYGLSVYDISDPAVSPYRSGYYVTPGHALGFDVSGNHLFVADDFYFGVYDISAAMESDHNALSFPTQLALLQNYPNPFNSSTDIRFDLPQAGHVSLKVFNITGREVATLKNEWMGAGEHHVNLDASSLPSGVYICRLAAHNHSQAQKMVLLK